MADYSTSDDKPKKRGKALEDAANDALQCFYNAYDYKKDSLEVMKEDYEVALGKIYSDQDIKEAAQSSGKKLLTFNQVSPILQLLVGLESQNRTDSKAFPQGKEDSKEAEVVTRLLKHCQDDSDGQEKMGVAAKNAWTCGEGYLLPYLDYTDSLLNAVLKWSFRSYFNVFPDPDSQEYDLSDASYVDVVTYDLTKEKLLQLYPEMEKKLKKQFAGKLDLDALRSRFNGGPVDDPALDGYANGSSVDFRPKKGLFDLLEHYFKKMVPKWVVINLQTNTMDEYETEEEADVAVEAVTESNIQQMVQGRLAEVDPLMALDLAEGIEQESRDNFDPDSVVVVKKRYIPEIWVTAVTGTLKEPLYHGVAWSYRRNPEDPKSKIKWRGYPIVPVYCKRLFTRLDAKDRHLQIQGITRTMKDKNWAFSKTITQEIHNLNTSANSGWIYGDKDLTEAQKESLKKFGSAPGIHIEYKTGQLKPERILPTPLATGHFTLAAQIKEEAQKEIGIDAAALAVGGSDASGKSLAIQDRKAMVMVQEPYDNLAHSKEIQARITMSQFAEIFDAEKVFRIMGEAWVKETFQYPRMDPMTGQPELGPDGLMILEFNEQSIADAKAFFSKVINDAEIGTYDVSVGQVLSSETIRFAQVERLKELGAPIELMIDKLDIPDSDQKKWAGMLQAQKQALQPTLRPGPINTDTANANSRTPGPLLN